MGRGRDPANLAHSDEKMSCYTCHTSWMTSCFGCHLSMKANANRPTLHNEGDVNTRNFTTYNFQVLRDDVFMLGLDSTAKNNGSCPVRSSSAVLVSSQNANREWIYHQEQTISSEGYSGQAFNPHYPHTVRTKETKTCTDCHISRENDNNAWMAQLLLQGTNFVNFIGRYAYVGEGRDGFQAVAVTEHDEPQAVIGSYLHKLAYPGKLSRHSRRSGNSPRPTSTAATRSACNCAASICTPPRAATAWRSTTSPTSITKASRSASSARRCRRWASAST